MLKARVFCCPEFICSGVPSRNWPPWMPGGEKPVTGGISIELCSAFLLLGMQQRRERKLLGKVGLFLTLLPSSLQLWMRREAEEMHGPENVPEPDGPD